jgi:hypothetical protein
LRQKYKAARTIRATAAIGTTTATAILPLFPRLPSELLVGLIAAPDDVLVADEVELVGGASPDVTVVTIVLVPPCGGVMTDVFTIVVVGADDEVDDVELVGGGVEDVGGVELVVVGGVEVGDVSGGVDDVVVGAGGLLLLVVIGGSPEAADGGLAEGPVGTLVVCDAASCGLLVLELVDMVKVWRFSRANSLDGSVMLATMEEY